MLCTYQIYTLISLESGDKRCVYLFSVPDRELPAGSRCFGSSLLRKRTQTGAETNARLFSLHAEFDLAISLFISPTSGAAVIRHSRAEAALTCGPLINFYLSDDTINVSVVSGLLGLFQD